MSKLRLVPETGGAPLEVAKNTVVGRDAGADVVVDDASVSRKHARIERKGDAWLVADQASANGTFLDGQRVTEAGLRHGQSLRFGNVTYKVEIEGSEDDLGATRLGMGAPPGLASPKPSPGATGASATGDAPKKGKSPMIWVGGCCGCLLLLAILVFVLSLVGAIAIPSLERARSGDTSAPAEQGGLRLEATEATKTRSGDGTKVEVTLTVTGYGTRPAGSNHEFDLQESLVTLDPDGIRVDSLSNDNIERRQNLTSSAEGDPQQFTSTLTIDSNPPAGPYSIRLTITDHISGAMGVKDVPFTLP
jgi:hypothetical protein